MTNNEHAVLEEIPATDGPRVVRLADLVDELVADAEAAHTARLTGQPRGPMTRLPAVDRALGGFLPPGVHLLQAAPGAGKTAFCLQTATDCGFPGLYVTVETSPLELFRRVIARLTRTDVGDLKSGKLAPAQVAARAREAAEKASRLAILDATLGFVPAEQIRTAALREECQASHVLVIIDPLQNWARSAHADASEYEKVTAAVEGAQRLTVKLGSPVLTVSQRNRAGQREGGLHAARAPATWNMRRRPSWSSRPTIRPTWTA